MCSFFLVSQWHHPVNEKLWHYLGNCLYVCIWGKWEWMNVIHFLVLSTTKFVFNNFFNFKSLYLFYIMCVWLFCRFLAPALTAITDCEWRVTIMAWLEEQLSLMKRNLLSLVARWQFLSWLTSLCTCRGKLVSIKSKCENKHFYYWLQLWVERCSLIEGGYQYQYSHSHYNFIPIALCEVFKMLRPKGKCGFAFAKLCNVWSVNAFPVCKLVSGLTKKSNVRC